MAEVSDDLERWTNESRGPVGVLRHDAIKGTKVELVRPGRQVMISSAERRLTEEAVKPDDNPFRNGRLYANQLAETSEDVAAIRSDPNVISKTEIEALMNGTLKQMEAKLAKITSPAALGKILDFANEEGATTRRVGVIRERISAVTGKAATPGAAGEPVMVGTTPSGGEREPYYPPDLGGRAPQGGSGAVAG